MRAMYFNNIRDGKERRIKLKKNEYQKKVCWPTGMQEKRGTTIKHNLMKKSLTHKNSDLIIKRREGRN